MFARIGGSIGTTRCANEKERSQDDNDDDTNNTISAGKQDAFLVFAGGGRSCVGYKMAMQEATIVLAALLRTFCFALAPSAPGTDLRVGWRRASRARGWRSDCCDLSKMNERDKHTSKHKQDVGGGKGILLEYGERVPMVKRGAACCRETARFGTTLESHAHPKKCMSQRLDALFTSTAKHDWLAGLIRSTSSQRQQDPQVASRISQPPICHSCKLHRIATKERTMGNLLCNANSCAPPHPIPAVDYGGTLTWYPDAVAWDVVLKLFKADLIFNNHRERHLLSMYVALSRTAQKIVLYTTYLMDPSRRSGPNLKELMNLARTFGLTDLDRIVPWNPRLFRFSDVRGLNHEPKIRRQWVQVWCRHSRDRSPDRDRYLLSRTRAWKLRGERMGDRKSEIKRRKEAVNFFLGTPAQRFFGVPSHLPIDDVLTMPIDAPPRSKPLVFRPLKEDEK